MATVLIKGWLKIPKAYRGIKSKCNTTRYTEICRLFHYIKAKKVHEASKQQDTPKHICTNIAKTKMRMSYIYRGIYQLTKMGLPYIYAANIKVYVL